MNSRNDLESGARLASLHRAAWKQALDRVVGPAVRLHHYRAAHNRLLQNALQHRDCPPARECSV